MDKDQLISEFMEHARKEYSKIYKKRTIGNWSSYLKKPPFDDIKIILSKWDVKGKQEYFYISKSNSRSWSCNNVTSYMFQYCKKHLLNKNIKDPKLDRYLDTVCAFLDNGDIEYAVTIIDIVIYLINKTVYFNDLSDDKIKDSQYLKGCQKALPYLKEYIELHSGNVQNVKCNETTKLRVDINKPIIHKIDGAIALARIIGIDNYIKYAIEQCYFFEPEIVKDRMCDLSNSLGNKEAVPARETTKELFSDSYGQSEEKGGNEEKSKWYYWEKEKDNDQIKDKFLITRDSDNNQAVRSLIKTYTGYVVGEGVNGIFQNYIISHIWGRAYDPRYFTNFWNIVLVPAWANGLLDKNAEEPGTLESKLKATIMQICFELYNLSDSDYNWENHKTFNMTCPQINNPEDVVNPQKKNKRNINSEETPQESKDYEFTINLIKNHGSLENEDGKLSVNKKKGSTNAVGYIVKHTIQLHPQKVEKK